MDTTSCEVTDLFLKCVQLRSALTASFIHLFLKCIRSHWALGTVLGTGDRIEGTTLKAPILEELSLS